MPPKGRARAAPRSTRGSAATAAAGDGSEQNQDSAAPATENVESTPLAIPPPSGRLEGLNNPTTMSRSTSRTGAGSPSIAGSSEKPKPKLKFAPKNTARKTKEEREQLNRQYDPPPPDESLNAFGITRGGSSARGARGRGRGRGGTSRVDPKREEVAVASGPFAMGSVMTNRGKQKVSIERSIRSSRPAASASTSRSRIKREGDESGYIKDEYSSSDSEGGPKLDVELIDLITDSEGEEAEKKHVSKGFAPVRIERHEHVDRTAAAAIEAKKRVEVKRDKGKGKEKEVEIVEERKSRSRRDSGTQRVKIESESPKVTRRTTKSPEQARKKQKSSSPEDKRRKPKPRSRSRSRKSTVVPQSQEDFEEHDRFELDRFQMLKELGPSLPARDPVDAEGDHEMEDAAAASHPSHDEKENKLYLFQFPPVLPVLEPVTAVDDENVAIKEEDSAATASASTTTKKEPQSPELRAKGGAANVKLEKERFSTLEEIQNAKLPVGTAGKLQVHRSGKVTILFGGIEFEVSRGVDCEFLQDVVVLQKESAQMDERGRPKGRAWGMGQLKGKFVVTPDIDKLLD